MMFERLSITDRDPITIHCIFGVFILNSNVYIMSRQYDES